MEQMQFIRKLPEPMEIKQEIPLKEEFRKLKEKRDQEIADIMTGKDDRFLLIIGPCSADNEPAVLDYCSRLAKVADEVKDRLFIVPRVYTNKPRTIGKGYKGMLHQPDPEGKENMMEGIKAIRRMHVHVIEQTGFTCAEEILYPEIIVTCRIFFLWRHWCPVRRRPAASYDCQRRRHSCRNENPTSGDLSVMMNSIEAAQSEQDFLFHGWEVHTTGNPLAHAILRGYVNHFGTSMPNYHYENLRKVADMYGERNLKNPAIVVDCNHNNSGKKYMEQIRIAKDVMASRQYADDIRHIVKGLMIESYIVDGNQKIGDGVYGKSITDPCLGWEKSRDLILSLADMV